MLNLILTPYKEEEKMKDSMSIPSCIKIADKVVIQTESRKERKSEEPNKSTNEYM